ncbi:hypothetical protein ACRAWD_31910 [Caulobacter segnis]
MPAIAAACGYGFVARVDGPEDLQARISQALAAGCAAFIEVRVNTRSRSDPPRPRGLGAAKVEFMRHLTRSRPRMSAGARPGRPRRRPDMVGPGRVRRELRSLEPRQGVWEAHLGAVPSALRPVVEFFLLSRAVSPDRLPEPVCVGLIPLAAAGLVETREAKMSP